MQSSAKKFTIGRDTGCDFLIADESVSRVHAELSILEGGRLFLADRNSRNGTRVVGQGQARQIQQDYVLPTEQIQFGQVTVSVAAVLEGLRRKHPGLFTPSVVAQPAPVQPAPVAAPQPSLAQGSSPRLVRCACGFIKPATRICPECGQ
jgi:pSer/pThr/pTyr-binding forkhead associated (FHA) protein